MSSSFEIQILKVSINYLLLVFICLCSVLAVISRKLQQKSSGYPVRMGSFDPRAHGVVVSSLDTPCARGPMGRNAHPVKYAINLSCALVYVFDLVHLRNLPPSVNSKYHLYSLTIGISSCGRTLWSSSSRLVFQLALFHCLHYLLSTWVR
jgi:hypothetical protein